MLSERLPLFSFPLAFVEGGDNVFIAVAVATRVTIQVKDTKFISFHTHVCVWNEMHLVPLACEDNHPLDYMYLCPNTILYLETNSYMLSTVLVKHPL